MNNPVSEVVTPRGRDEQCQAAGRQRPSVVAIQGPGCRMFLHLRQYPSNLIQIDVEECHLILEEDRQFGSEEGHFQKVNRSQLSGAPILDVEKKSVKPGDNSTRMKTEVTWRVLRLAHDSQH